ncbi:MAG TPA: hypothetical protein VM143_06770 [Acidimicrobiales bacterium]|nr:hypothetical protein [Acidimicrobiales bacterium]
MSRRVAFFVIAAIVCALLTLAAPVALRWVPETVAAVYAFLAILTAIELWAADREHREP